MNPPLSPRAAGLAALTKAIGDHRAARRSGVVVSAKHQHQQARALRGRRLPVRKKLPHQVEPDAVAMAFYGTLRAVVGRARALLEADLVKQLPALARRANVGQNVHDAVVHAVERAAADWSREYPRQRLEQLVAHHARLISDFQRAQLQRQLRAGLGALPPMPDRGVPARLAAFATEGAAKVRALVLAYFADVQGRTLRALRPKPHHDAPPADGGIGGGGEEGGEELYILEGRVSVHDFVLELGRRGEVADSRSAQMATFDTRSLFADLNQDRQKVLGLEEYDWTTMGDDHVRPEHEALDGRRCSWDSPPAIGNPGEPPNCRCYATPVLAGLQAELQ